MGPIGGAVESRVAEPFAVLLVRSLKPFGEARETSFLGLSIKGNADLEECVDGEIGADGCLVSVVGVQF